MRRVTAVGQGRPPYRACRLVEGPTLAEKIAASAGWRSGGLPIAEALTLARQIADALDAAHDKGVIHRDLKPANVKVTPDGVVKVLDFGLSKPTSHDVAALAESTPTTTDIGTRAGLIVGTAGYMSPEQARGLAVDKRTDIWAFGCVLYELLTTRAAFVRDTTTDTLAAIVEREPDWTALPATTPPGIRRLLRRCLEKDVKRRLHDIADARIEIDDALARQTSTASPAGADGNIGFCQPGIAPGRPRPSSAWLSRFSRLRGISGRQALPSSREIFYRSIDGTSMLAVEVGLSPTASVGPPRQLFAGQFATSATGGNYWSEYDLSPDGEHFLMLAADETTAPRLNVVVGWAEALRR